MRYVADLRSLTPSKFEDLPAPYVRWLINEVLAIDANESLKRGVEDQLKLLNDPELRQDTEFARRISLLQRAREGLVWSKNGEARVKAFNLGTSGSIAEEFEILQEACEARRDELATLKAGMKRSIEYNRTIGQFPPLAKSIHLSDPYVGKAVHDARRPNSGQQARQWLLRRLLTDAPMADITVTTALVEGLKYTNMFKPVDFARALFNEFQDMLAESPNYRGKFRLRVFPHDPIFHDRYLQFNFDKGSFGLFLGKGTDDYMKDPLQKNIIPAFVDGSAVALAQADINRLGVVFEGTI